MKQTSGHIIVQFKNLITPFFTILHHKTCPFRSRELSLKHEDKKGDFKRERSNKHRRTHGCSVRQTRNTRTWKVPGRSPYLCEWTCQNCGMSDLTKGTEITGFSCPFRRADKHYLRNVKFFFDADKKRWLFEKSALSSLMYLVEY